MITRRQFTASTPWLAASPLALAGCSQEPAADGYETVAERTWQRPDLVVRFGRGPMLPRSLRRPVEAVLV
jgi:hypothetical protein